MTHLKLLYILPGLKACTLLGAESSKQLGGVSEVCQIGGELLAHKIGAVFRSKRELINH